MLVFSRFCITPYQHTCFYDISFVLICFFFFFQAEDGIRDIGVTGVQTCALPIYEVVERSRGDEDHLSGADGLGVPSEDRAALSFDEQEQLVALVRLLADVVARDRKSVV